MNLIREKWEEKDVKDFQKYLISFASTDKNKIVWGTNLLNTSLKVLVIPTPFLKKIIKEISMGNYLSFLDLMIWEYYENTAINGYLISNIKDFNTYQKYLDIYSKKVDNWASCDLLTFNIKGFEKEFFNLAINYTKSKYTFRRRIGIIIIFNYVNNINYIDDIFNILNTFYHEEEYYVNMVNAWLLCECFIKQRELTLKYLSNHKLNKFTINKAISKCRDSRRVSKEDKEMLLKFKKVSN